MRALVVLLGESDAARSFVPRLREVFAGIEQHVGHARLDVRSGSQLEDLLPDTRMPIGREERAQCERIKAFDLLDVVIVYATPDALPWHSHAQQAVWLVRNCLLTRKCVLAVGGGLQLISFVLATGAELSERVRVLPGHAPPWEPPTASVVGRASADLSALWLERATGTLWRHVGRAAHAHGGWEVAGDAGSHMDSGHPDAPHRHVNERARDAESAAFARTPGTRRLRARVHTSARAHAYFADQPAEVVLSSRTRWHCHLQPPFDAGPLGVARVLLHHPHGVQALEVGNTLALQAELERGEDDGGGAVRLCRRFLVARHALIQARVDGRAGLHADEARGAPLQLAFIVAQWHVEHVPSAALDAVAALAPHVGPYFGMRSHTHAGGGGGADEAAAEGAAWAWEATGEAAWGGAPDGPPGEERRSRGGPRPQSARRAPRTAGALRAPARPLSAHGGVTARQSQRPAALHGALPADGSGPELFAPCERVMRLAPHGRGVPYNSWARRQEEIKRLDAAGGPATLAAASGPFASAEDVRRLAEKAARATSIHDRPFRL